MRKTQDFIRKLVATLVAVTVMCAMLWFAYSMLITTPVFEGTLRIILLCCIGLLTLATLYFFVCKVLEMISMFKKPKPIPEQEEKQPETTTSAE